MGDWNENEHPRGTDGTWVDKESRAPGGTGDLGGGSVDVLAGFPGDGDGHPRDMEGMWADAGALRPGDGDHPRQASDGSGLMVSTMAGPAGLRLKPMGMNDYESDMHTLAEGLVTVGPDGLVDPSGRPIGTQALRDSPHSRKLIRSVLNGEALESVPPKDRKRVFRQAFAAASPYMRRKAIAGDPSLARYIPAATMARSLRARKADEAVNILVGINGEDRAASAAIIRSGFPNSRGTAMSFINKTKAVDQKVITRGERAGKTQYFNTSARRYLRVRWCSGQGENRMKGAPDESEMRRMRVRFRNLDGDPQAQAKLMYSLAYGPKGERNGVAAEMLAYEGAMTREGAAAFLEMEKDRQPPANSKLHPEQERMTSFRANLHAMAAVGSTRASQSPVTA